jgi:hypothetical protein
MGLWKEFDKSSFNVYSGNPGNQVILNHLGLQYEPFYKRKNLTTCQQDVFATGL